MLLAQLHYTYAMWCMPEMRWPNESRFRQNIQKYGHGFKLGFKENPIYKKWDNGIVHFDRFWKANCPSLQAFDSGSKIQVFALDALGVVLSDQDFLCREATWVGTPIIAKPKLDPDSVVLEELEEPPKCGIRSTAQNKRDDLARVMVYQVPSPARLAFLAYKRPELVRFGAFDAHFEPFLAPALQNGRVDRF